MSAEHDSPALDANHSASRMIGRSNCNVRLARNDTLDERVEILWRIAAVRIDRAHNQSRACCQSGSNRRAHTAVYNMLPANKACVLRNRGTHHVPGRVRAPIVDKTVFNIEIRLEAFLQQGELLAQ